LSKLRYILIRFERWRIGKTGTHVPAHVTGLRAQDQALEQKVTFICFLSVKCFDGLPAESDCRGDPISISRGMKRPKDPTLEDRILLADRPIPSSIVHLSSSNYANGILCHNCIPEDRLSKLMKIFWLSGSQNQCTEYVIVIQDSHLDQNASTGGMSQSLCMQPGRQPNY
jgi:hypothetical protein